MAPKLHAGERILYEGHPSWRSILGLYLKGFAITAAVALVVALVSSLGEGGADTGLVTIVALVGVALTILIGFIKRVATSYTITNRRLHIRRGILSRNIEETRLDRVQDVRVRQGLGQRVLGVGTVDFGTSAESGAGFRFEGIANPDHVARQIDRVLHEADAPAPPVPPQQA